MIFVSLKTDINLDISYVVLHYLHIIYILLYLFLEKID